MNAAHGARSSPGESFLSRLEALARHHYQHRHPFNALMLEGRLEPDDLRLWVANRYHYQTRIPIKDALILAKSEDPVFRRRWVQRVLDHDGRGEPGRQDTASGEPGQLELWRRFGAALGLSELELASGAHVLPEVRAACDRFVEEVRRADLVTAVAFSLTERFASSLLQLQIEAWLAHYSGVDQRSLDGLGQLALHLQGGAEHALAFVQAEATTPELERRCLDAFAAKCAMIWRLLDVVYLARRGPRLPFIQSNVWLMRLSALGVEDEQQQSSAPGVLMGPERALSLNRTGYDLLERCDGQRSLATVVAELAQRHAAPVALVERDVATFVAELERRGVLGYRSAAGS